MTFENEKWMQLALEQAELAFAADEVPVGAVVVIDDKLVAASHNMPITTTSPTAHAEILALNKAAQSIDNYRLVGATLYVTLEPCLMCYGAMVHARVANCIYAASDPKSGVESCGLVSASAAGVNHKVDFKSGIMAAQAKSLLQTFFKAKRN